MVDTGHTQPSRDFCHKPQVVPQKQGHGRPLGACGNNFRRNADQITEVWCRTLALAYSSLGLVRHPYLRALRGSSVSTVFSSGWKRKSSTYSPNLS